MKAAIEELNTTIQKIGENLSQHQAAPQSAPNAQASNNKENIEEAEVEILDDEK